MDGSIVAGCVVIVAILAMSGISGLLTRTQERRKSKKEQYARDVFYACDNALAELLRYYSKPAPPDIDWLNVTLTASSRQARLEGAVKAYVKQLITLSVAARIEGLCWHQLYMHACNKAGDVHGTLLVGAWGEAPSEEPLLLSAESLDVLSTLIEKTTPEVAKLTTHIKQYLNS